jgi:hypothetical protein
MATATVDPRVSTAISKVMSSVGTGDAKGYQTGGGPSEESVAYAGILTTGIQSGILLNPRLAAGAKAARLAPTVDEATVASKDFWGDLLGVVNQTLPVVFSLFGAKDYKAPQSAADVLNSAPSYLRNDKDFWTFLEQTLTTTVPQIINMIDGKAYQVDSIPDVPSGKSKDWFSDALGIAGQVLPFVLSFL